MLYRKPYCTPRFPLVFKLQTKKIENAIFSSLSYQIKDNFVLDKKAHCVFSLR